jgi:hypothetical protein
MSEFSGAKLYVEFKGTAISSDFRQWKDNGEMGLVDASSGADTARTYLKTLLDGTATLTALYQTDGTGATYVYNLCAEGAEGSLIIGPEGNQTGKPKKTVNAIVKKRSRSIPYKDVVELTIDFQFSGAPTDGTFA